MYKKLFVFILLTAIVSVSLMGCGDGPSVSKSKDVDEIQLLQLEGFNLANATILKSFTEGEEIQNILSAIENSEQLPGILDMLAPDYALRIFHKEGDTQAFYLWTEFISNRYSGVIVDVEETGIGYTLKEDAAKYLHQLIND